MTGYQGALWFTVGIGIGILGMVGFVLYGITQ